MGAARLGTRAIAGREAIARVCAQDMAPLELLERVARRVRPVVPYSAAGWLLTDPATLLHTGAFVEDVAPDVHAGLIDQELGGADFGTFSQLARRPRPVLALSDATGGALQRSGRHRMLYAPRGIAHEVRGVFRVHDACWGVFCLTRNEGEPDFDAAEQQFLASITEPVGHALCRAQLVAGCVGDDAAAIGAQAPAMVVLRDDDTLESVSGDAERWLADLPTAGLGLPLVVYELARRARAAADTDGPGDEPAAHARVRLSCGTWLALHGVRLRASGSGGGRTAVVLQRARRADLAPLIVAMHALTERERQVTERLASGMPVEAIARSLWITTHTLRDHVKAIYAKFGVSSRAELTAMLFFEHVLPEFRLRSADEPAQDPPAGGWRHASP